MIEINADQVAWVGNALERYRKTLIHSATFPSCSKLHEAAQTVCMLEIMDCLNLQFQDDAARDNAFSGLMTKTAQESNNIVAVG